MSEAIESQEFIKYARDNCYSYGCLDIYVPNGVSLDKHAFPRYQSQANGSALEKFMVLMQGIGSNAKGNDPTTKLPRTLPTVQWGEDDLSVSISVQGTMYFYNYSDYKTIFGKLRSMMLSQGWTVSSSVVASRVPIVSYRPTAKGVSALYADDPIDAVGMAMLTNAMQNLTSEIDVITSLESKKVTDFAQALARREGRAQNVKMDVPIGGTGLIGDVLAGVEALGTNTSAGMINAWSTAGFAIKHKVAGSVIQKSVRGVLSSADFKYKAFVVDDSSNNQVYPSQMDVSIDVVNPYGALLNNMKQEK